MSDEKVREESAALVEARIWQKDSSGRFRYGPETRVALAIAAKDVRRGRPLTEREQLENLRAAMEEDPCKSLEAP